MRRITPAERRQWQEEGWLLAEGAVSGEPLRRLQRAFDGCAERFKPGWLAQLESGEAAGSYYDLPDPMAWDGAFRDLADCPGFHGLARDLLGEDIILVELQARMVPRWPVSYSAWHRDVPAGHPLHIKVQLYVSDVAPGGGELGYVPRSHLWEEEAEGYPVVRRLESMPGHRRFPGPAGTAILFNGRGLHTAMDNRRGPHRKSVILIYEARRPGRIPPSLVAAARDWATTPERRRLLGLEP
jgi:phytanoyl-CoA dioxygenase PhyH